MCGPSLPLTYFKNLSTQVSPIIIYCMHEKRYREEHEGRQKNVSVQWTIRFLLLDYNSLTYPLSRSPYHHKHMPSWSDRSGSSQDKSLGLCPAQSMDRGMSRSGLLGWLTLLALLDFRIHQAIVSVLSAHRHLPPQKLQLNAESVAPWRSDQVPSSSLRSLYPYLS